MTETWQWSNILLNGHSQQYQAGYQELTPDAGCITRRIAFSDVNNIKTGSVLLTKRDFVYFKDWYLNTIKQGTIKFSMFDCELGQYVMASFVGNYNANAEGKYYRLSFALAFEQSGITQEEWLITNDDYIISTFDGYGLLKNRLFKV